jgi:hypothetical protein
VRAVRRAEGVVDVNVGQRGELLRELRIVFLLFFVKAKILQQHDFGAGFVNQRVDLRPDAIRREDDGAAQQLLQRGAHRREAPLGTFLAARAAEVGGDDQLLRFR